MGNPTRRTWVIPLILILGLLAISCGGESVSAPPIAIATGVPGPTPVTNATVSSAPLSTSAPTPTFTPVPTPTSTPTPVPTPTAVPRTEPDFVFGPGITPELEQELREATRMVRDFTARELGYQTGDFTLFAFNERVRHIEAYAEQLNQNVDTVLARWPDRGPELDSSICSYDMTGIP